MKKIILLVSVLLLLSACVHTDKMEETTSVDTELSESSAEEASVIPGEESTSAESEESTGISAEDRTSSQAATISDVSIDEIKTLFFETEKAYSYFTGYADNDVYADGTIEINGQRYNRCSLANSLDGLRELVSPYISPENTEKLINKTVSDGVPLFVESDNILWRFGGFIAQWGLDAAVTEIVSAVPGADGTIKVEVNITMPEFKLETTAIYTCTQAEQGSLMFTDDFQLPIELLMKDADI